METEETHDIRLDTKLNRFALELEAERQTSLVAHWGEVLANAKQERDKAELDLDVLKAQKGNHYRATLAKATADAVKDAVQSDPEVIQAQQNWNDAQHLVDITYSAVNAIDQKKSMIETLAKLYLSNYYNKPNDKQTQGTTLNQSMNDKD